ncbi:MAG: polyprenyl synthetase family protein [bacterium]
MANFDFNEYIQENIKIIDSHLNNYLENRYPQKLWESMRYTVLADGKRLRPLLVMEAARACGGNIEEVIPTACAIEMIHSYSLIHDDLPCMDDDDFRRGNPTNHKVFGEATAVLAGDALLSHAPLLILENTPETVKKENLHFVLKELFEAIGPMGLIAGQVVDIESENEDIDIAKLEYIHTHKTGKLFIFALRAGAILSEASEEQLDALTYYAKHVGYSFQIADDILDIIGTKESLGKTPGKDIKSNKKTYPVLFGINEAKEEVKRLCTLAVNKLEENNVLTPALQNIADGIWQKVNK